MPKTVYILGAGASAGSDFALPVMKGFFREEDLSRKSYQNLSTYIRKFFAGVPFDELDLEEIITQLELSIEGLGALWERSPRDSSELEFARQEFDNYVRMRLRISSRDTWDPARKNPEAVCKIHKDFFSNVGKNDTVISLNYDLVADVALYDVSPRNAHGDLSSDSIAFRSELLLGKSVTIEREIPSIHYEHLRLGYYLKLHGSLHWLYCPNPACSHHEQFFIARGHRPGHPCILCGSSLTSVIIPPALGKSFQKFPKMGFLWNLAYREISYCWELILIGLSFPDSDYYIRWLLREAKRRNNNLSYIVVVNPDVDARERAFKLLGASSEDRESFDSLKDFVDQMG